MDGEEVMGIVREIERERQGERERGEEREEESGRMRAERRKMDLNALKNE